MLMNQLGDGRARHEDPLINIELEAGKPGLVHEVRHRHTLLDALRSAARHRQFPGTDATLINGRRICVREAQMREYEPRGFVNGIVGTVAIVQLGRNEASAMSPNQLLDSGDLSRIAVP